MTFSATRISNWIACQRLGGFEYICGYRQPPDDAQALGERVHAYLETLKRTPGTLPDLTDEIGEIAAEALPYVEDFRLDNGAEFEGHSASCPPGCDGRKHPFTIQGRHTWQGYKDVRLSRDGLAAVVDYKTTGDFRYAKTEEDLLGDPQAILYAEDEYRRGAQAVALRWLYLKKRKPYGARPTDMVIQRAHAAAGFAALESFADEMQAAADAAPEDPAGKHRFVLEVLQPNWDHCTAYRRPCPHTARCGTSLFRDPNELRKKPQMELLARLQAYTALNGGPANAAPALPPTAAYQPPVPVAAPPGTPGTFQVHAAGGEASLQPGVYQAPPPAAPPPPAQVVQTPSGTTTFDSTWTQPPASAEAVPAEVAPGQVNPPKRGPGRPRKPKAEEAPATAPVAAPAPIAPTMAAMAAVQPGQPVVIQTAPAAPAAAAPPPAPVAPAPGPHRIGTLFVGCVLQGMIGELPNFDVMIAKAKVAIGPQDWRTVDYGKGAGMLLDMFRAVLEYEKPAALLVSDARTPEATLALSYLRSISDSIVEGVR